MDLDPQDPVGGRRDMTPQSPKYQKKIYPDHGSREELLRIFQQLMNYLGPGIPGVSQVPNPEAVSRDQGHLRRAEKCL